MAAQLALVDAPGERFFEQRGRGQCGEQLGVEQALYQIGLRCQITSGPAGPMETSIPGGGLLLLLN